MTVMTTTTAQTVTNPRDLMAPALFDALAQRVMKDEGVDRGYAERVIEQTIIFLKACGMRGSEAKLCPSVQVDPGWHAFLLYTRDYAEFCQQIAGQFIHHRPIREKDSSDGAALGRTLVAIRETGFAVDVELWDAPESCAPCCDKG
jgi:hypothetical protein